MKKEWGGEKEKKDRKREKKKVESTKPHFTQVSVT